MQCNNILDKIASGIRANWSCQKLDNDAMLIITDVLLPNNDCIEIMVEREDAGFNINDMGLLTDYLYLHGIDLTSNVNKKKVLQIDRILKNYQAEYVDNQIERRVSVSELPYAINRLSHAIREAAVLHYSIRPRLKGDFKESVYTFFKSENADVYMYFEVAGQIKETHTIDIRLNGNSEWLSKTISTTTPTRFQEQFERACFAFTDLRDSQRSFTPAIIFDDTTAKREKAIRNDHIEQIKRTDIDFYRFKKDATLLKAIAHQHPWLQI